jgi:signal transduction histidine kinase/FixJ family two-component response regulator
MTGAHLALAPQAERLTWLYILALSAVACLSIAGQALVQWSLDRQLSDSTVVNLAGRQRMLSQRLTKAALARQRSSSPNEIAARNQEISEALAEWRQCDEGLRRGDSILRLPGRNSPVVQEMLADLEPHFHAMETAAASLLRADGSPLAALDEVLSHESRFLVVMDAIVKQYEREARYRVAWLKGIERGLLLLTLLVLACEGLFVFRPAIRRLRSTAAAMEQSRQQMETAKQLADSANEAKSRFLATISHELRNPLQAILSSVDLANHTTDNAKRLAHLETISTAARALLVLLNDLLDLARIEAGKLAIASAPFDVVLLTERTLALVKSQANDKGLQLDWQCSDSIPHGLCGDEIRIQQVILNLLTNALKFTPTGSVSVRLSLVSQNDEFVRLRWEVRDTGIGIADDQRSVIFDRFTQISGVSERRGGAGLGLAICKRLVELMMGEIGIESKLGVGSTFWFELPLVQPVNGTFPVVDRGEMPRAAEPKHVLLVDDDPVNRRLLLQLVESLGHRAFAAANGEEAMAKYREESFDVAILDWQLPDMNGGKLASILQKLERDLTRPHTTLIALSAAIQRRTGAEADGSCFDHWLTKPVSRSELAMVLTTAEAIPTACDDHRLRWTEPLRRLGGRRELLIQLAQTWSAALPDMLDRLETASQKNSADEVVRMAHLLAGQASIFEAHELMSVAKSLEEHASNSVDMSLVATLAAQCQKLNAELESWLAEAKLPAL